ncbi:MAG: hypothetical protein KAU28_04645, partial [Phycisphaerae bacterium]|nr:hypothetical protein [Phycisphaerae bacterium]
MAASRPASAPASQPAPDAEAERLFTSGIEKALAGDFEEGLGLLREVGRSAPDDATVQAAVELLGHFIRTRTSSEGERAKEYIQAVQRVRRGLSVQEYLG